MHSFLFYAVLSCFMLYIIIIFRLLVYHMLVTDLFVKHDLLMTISLVAFTI
jgi:hypothetical protein